MNLIDKIEQIQRLDALIRRKATGSPRELASRFNMSERCVYRLIDEMRSMGCPIEYCRTRGSYQYSAAIELQLSFEIREKCQKAIVGGQRFMHVFSLLPFFGSKEKDL